MDNQVQYKIIHYYLLKCNPAIYSTIFQKQNVIIKTLDSTTIKSSGFSIISFIFSIFLP